MKEKETIFIRNTEARRAQLDLIAKRTGRAGDTDGVDFALCLACAILDGGQVRGFDLSAGSLAAVPDIEESASNLFDAWESGEVTGRKAREQFTQLLRQAVYQMAAQTLAARADARPESDLQEIIEGLTDDGKTLLAALEAMHAARLDAIDKWIMRSVS